MKGAHETETPAAPGLDADIRRFVDAMSASWSSHPGLATASPPELRRIAEAVRAPWARGGPRMQRTFERDVPATPGPVRIRIYDPSGATRQPALVYLHGGGWTIFSLDTHDRLMRELAARAGITVVGVDYALAPEHRFPIALSQVVAVVRYLAGDAGVSELAIDPRRLAIGGDSAGANLAVATALALRERGLGSCLRAMLLNYGVFARHSSPAAVALFGGPGNMLTDSEMEGFWRNYLGDERDAENPLACPMLAQPAGLPAARFVVGGRDLLTEQSFAMHTRFRAAGVESTLAVYEGASHSFLEAVSVSALAERALGEAAGWLRDVLVSAE